MFLLDSVGGYPRVGDRLSSAPWWQAPGWRRYSQPAWKKILCVSSRVAVFRIALRVVWECCVSPSSVGILFSADFCWDSAGSYPPIFVEVR